jgi:hypothetical protein
VKLESLEDATTQGYSGRRGTVHPLPPSTQTSLLSLRLKQRLGLWDASRVSDYFSRVQEDDTSCRHISIILQRDGDFPSGVRLL